MSSQNRQPNKVHDFFQDNLHEASGMKERKQFERQQRLNQERASIDQLNREIANEEQAKNSRKTAIKNEQFQEYSNYMKQKSEENPYIRKKKESLEIKIGGENRHLTRKNYDEANNNLCLNPMSANVNSQNKQPQNLGEQGRAQPRAQNHGYNILTGEIFGSKPPQGSSQYNMNYNVQDSRRIENENYLHDKANEANYANYENLPPRKVKEIEGYDNKENYYSNNEKQIPVSQQQNQYSPPQYPQDHDLQQENSNKLTEEDYKRYYEYLEMLKQNEENPNMKHEQKQPSYAQQQPLDPQQLYPQSPREPALYQASNEMYNEYMNSQSPQSNQQQINPDELSSQMHKMSIQEESRNEYLANKKRNTNSFNDMASPQVQPIMQKDSNGFTNKVDKQRMYKEYLDNQMKAKEIYKETIDNMNQNSQQNNPYKAMRDKNRKLNDIPANPYSNKNYNFGGSNLNANPLTNPVNSYKFKDQRQNSGTLKNLGSNIIGK